MTRDDLLDAVSLVSFFIALENLEMNITQEDMQEVETKFNERLETILQEIHGHLAEQDKKLDLLLGGNYEENRMDA